MFYDDDGETPDAYEKGNYEILHFTSRVHGNSITVTIESEAGKNYPVRERKINFLFYDQNIVAEYPTKIKTGKKQVITIRLKEKQ